MALKDYFTRTMQKPIRYVILFVKGHGADGKSARKSDNPIEIAAGMLADDTFLTQALLREHEQARKSEW